MPKGLGWGGPALWAPLVFFLAILFVTLNSIRSDYGGLAFVDDTSYVQCQFARQIQQGIPPGLSEDQPSPMTRVGLYTLLLSSVYAVTGNMPTSVYLLGGLIGVLTIFQIYRLGATLGLKGWVLRLALFLVVVHPIILQAAITANGDGLFILLVSTSLCQYWIQTKRGDLGLSLASLIPLALAASIQIEAITVLAWMGLAAFLTQILGERDRANAGAALVFIATGVFLTALCLAPAVFYHLREFNVPWPRYADSVLAIHALGDMESGSPSAGPTAFACLLSHGALMMPWPGLLTLFASLASLGLLALRRTALPLELLSLFLVPPILAGWLVPATGHQGLPPLAASLAPALLILSLVVSAQTLQLAHDRFGLPAQRWKGWPLPALAGSLFFLVIGLQGLGLSCLTRANTLKLLQEQRGKILQALKGGSGTLVSDRPGWLAWSQDQKVLDSQGHYSINVLARMNASGEISAGNWTTLVKEEGIESWVIWSKEAADGLRAAGIVDLPAEGNIPRVMLRGRAAAL